MFQTQKKTLSLLDNPQFFNALQLSVWLLPNDVTFPLDMLELYIPYAWNESIMQAKQEGVRYACPLAAEDATNAGLCMTDSDNSY